MKQRDRFRDSHRLVWITLSSAIALQVLALAMMGEAAAAVLTASIPSMLMLVAAWSGITNWSEVRAPSLPAYDDDNRGRGSDEDEDDDDAQEHPTKVRRGQ